MPGLTTLKTMKKGLMRGLFATALTAVMALQAGGAAVEAAPGLWSIAAHFEYQDGFEFDYVIATGVSTADMPAMLAECGRSHWTGSVVRYHCYPIPE